MSETTTLDVPARWRDYSEPTLPPLLQSALESFVVQGYHGTTMRTLAAHAGLSVPGLYHHYDSKHAIIVAIMERAMEDLYARSIAALEASGPSAEERFRTYIECLVLFHANRGDLAFVAASEIRSLEPAARDRHVAARDRQQAILEKIVEDGIAEGDFSPEYPRDSTRAIITMCTGVAQWYTPTGPLSPDELARRYTAMSLKAVGRPAS
jgi:AcrR family transcriptional regulator